MMSTYQKWCPFFLLLLHLLVIVVGIKDYNYTRHDFPHSFVFGSGSAAYQVEGAAFEDGKTPSIWDTFAHAGFHDGATGDIACDSYHKYKEDVQLMANIGLEAYRFSISWSRLIPNGRGPVNPKGLQYYNNLIDELISHGIQPHVTLYHCDLPQALEDEYMGWLSRKIVEDFTAFVDVCFKEFGDRVLHWTTINEANILALGGYDQGLIPPKRCSAPFGFNCTGGNSSTEVYIVGHNMLLAHSSAARLYQRKYKYVQQGFVGINVYSLAYLPYTNSEADIIAVQRVLDFYIGWFIKPLIFGDYPQTMKKNVGSRLPTFTKRDSELVKGSLDFIGLNHYAQAYVRDSPSSLQKDLRDFILDTGVAISFEGYLPNEPPPGELPIRPAGLSDLLEHFKQVYGNPPIYVHENGKQTLRNGTLNDTKRVEYLHAYIGGVLDALRNGSNTRGYFQWSFLDGLEILSGLKTSYGLFYVDLDDKELTRYPKLSAFWYSNFLKRRSTVLEVGNKITETN
ncbi:Beta-glucosidase 11 [Capsicum chinense]|nr:Beta-glucosidase 11 [Capsicum chinense]